MELNFFVKSWRDRGDKEFDNKTKNGNIFAFTCYFIAFNALYNSVCEQCPKVEKKNNALNNFPLDYYSCPSAKHCHERDKIKRYYDSTKYAWDKIHPYEIIKEDSEYLTLVMKNNKKSYKALEKNLKEKNIETLILSVYQVRCNLFHGSKDMMNDRDHNLIKDGALILRIFLHTIYPD